MAEIYGIASIYGVNHQFLYAGIALPAGYLNVEAVYNDSLNQSFLLNAEGDLACIKITNTRGEAAISFIPVGSSAHNTIAAAKTGVYLPPPYSVVIIRNAPGFLNGFWNYAGGGTLRQRYNDFSVMTLPLVRYNKIDPRYLANTIKVA